MPDFARWRETYAHDVLGSSPKLTQALQFVRRIAGHRSTQTTLLYIHLSGRDLAEKIARGMAAIHEWRAATTAEVLR